MAHLIVSESSLICIEQLSNIIDITPSYNQKQGLLKGKRQETPINWQNYWRLCIFFDLEEKPHEITSKLFLHIGV